MGWRHKLRPAGRHFAAPMLSSFWSTTLPVPAALLVLQYIFTTKPLSSGEFMTTISSGPEAAFTGLTPATQVGDT